MKYSMVIAIRLTTQTLAIISHAKCYETVLGGSRVNNILVGLIYLLCTYMECTGYLQKLFTLGVQSVGRMVAEQLSNVGNTDFKKPSPSQDKPPVRSPVIALIFYKSTNKGKMKHKTASTIQNRQDKTTTRLKLKNKVVLANEVKLMKASQSVSLTVSQCVCARQLARERKKQLNGCFNLKGQKE